LAIHRRLVGKTLKVVNTHRSDASCETKKPTVLGSLIRT
jgi:hypothetical protein